MSDSKKILAVGSIAFDTIHTPKGSRDKILGGSSTYFSVAASRYSNVSLIGIVGDDFTDKEWELFTQYNINTDSIEICEGNTFSWGGKYNKDYSIILDIFFGTCVSEIKSVKGGESHNFTSFSTLENENEGDISKYSDYCDDENFEFSINFWQETKKKKTNFHQV